MSPAQAASDNPAVVAGGTGGVAVVGVVWFAGNVWPKVALSAEAGATIATIAGTTLGFLARNGLAGLWRIIRYGSSAARPPAVG